MFTTCYPLNMETTTGLTDALALLNDRTGFVWFSATRVPRNRWEVTISVGYPTELRVIRENAELDTAIADALAVHGIEIDRYRTINVPFLDGTSVDISADPEAQ